MKRELLVSLGFVGLITLLASADARAQDAGRRTAGPLDAGAVVPAGHPAMPTGDDGAEEDPHGGGAASPHGGGGGGAAAGGGGAEAPEDAVLEDPTAPKGTIEVQIADPMGKPLGRTEVTLGILYNSIAKGDSRKRVNKMSDDAGVARFTDLDIGSGVAYRPMVLKDGATFSVTPFALGPKGGMRALLHVYPVTNDVDQTLIVTQSMVYAEVKDDRIQVQQAFKIYNFGRNAWVPKDMVVPLPEGYTAFATQQSMTDVGADPIPNKGVKLRGTFGPGQHIIEFKWQLPYAGEAEMKFDVGMPPHLAAARVIAPASKGMDMEVEGFEKSKPSNDGAGQRALVTERQLRRDEPPVKSITVMIKGLPTEGPGKVIASFLALGGIVMGIALGSRKTAPRDTKRERQQLLAALEGLELGHRDGSIGPKTYERARRDLIDDIARSFAADPPKAPAKRARTVRKKPS
jgi:hypothetical protein